ncbi:MAG: YbaB/EbfC family nucleoid-associated protein [Eubacteriaceae bacterium]|nr:YbaB/EbfC family nucleoid-associated protein [Eubacteriaceae bacterium]MBR5996034.1 YbaB/EbfC family nucleoid-associated protein [Eubacteriaceae bacterium]
MAKYQQPNMNNLMKQAKKMQEMMAAAQEEILAMEFEAASGGGAVKAVVTGDRKLKSLFIDPDAMADADSEMLSDMIIAAVNEALVKADETSAAKLGSVTGGLNIPGMR